MSFAAVRPGEPIPTYNGKDYPYWKDKMMRNMVAIHPAGWEIVKDGVIIKDNKEITADGIKCIGLDAEVRVFITNHISADKYLEVSNISSAKGVWDYLEKIGEGASTQKDARIDTSKQILSIRSKGWRKGGIPIQQTHHSLQRSCRPWCSRYHRSFGCQAIALVFGRI